MGSKVRCLNSLFYPSCGFFTKLLFTVDYWKARYDKEGYAGLEKYESRAAHKLNKKDASIEQAVIRMKKEHEDWGKRRIAEEMAKANNWEPLVSLNTVKRILESAGMWAAPEPKKKERA